MVNFGARALETRCFGFGFKCVGRRSSLCLRTQGSVVGVGFRFWLIWDDRRAPWQRQKLAGYG
jgi:hypothetical protein